MPRAEAYLVSVDGRRRLEDRFMRADLWTSRTVTGRWFDDDGRVFTLSRLEIQPPAVDNWGTVTRIAYESEAVAFDRRKVLSGGVHAVAFHDALSRLSPVAVPERKRGVPPRQLPRGYDDVDYWQGTNETAIVCAFLPEKTSSWHLATWELAPGDDFDECVKVFEREFLSDEYHRFVESGRDPDRPQKQNAKPWTDSRRKSSNASPQVREREALRRDARHSVAAYEKWHVTDAEEFTIIDDLPSGREFIATLTNDLPVMRRKYASAVPTHIDGSNVLCVARIFADRDEYVDALMLSGRTNMTWSAAYWCPGRREIVAHLSDWGGQRLLRTFRHEAFHQYLSYATAMISASPWLNEGYAQFFEDETSLDWELGYRPKPDDLERFSGMLPGLFAMDYEAFYAGSNEERHLKYRLAWSVVVFMEKEMRNVRHDPFRDLKKDYFDELFRSQDMFRATNAAFRDKDRLGLFVDEWLRFWKEL